MISFLLSYLILFIKVLGLEFLAGFSWMVLLPVLSGVTHFVRKNTAYKESAQEKLTSKSRFNGRHEPSG
jgi:hypothetical protein